MRPPVKPQFPTFRNNALCRFAADRWTEPEHQLSVFGHQRARSECKTQKIELLLLDLAFLTPSFSIAVNEFSLFGM